MPVSDPFLTPSEHVGAWHVHVSPVGQSIGLPFLLLVLLVMVAS
jgi:hypothetical protein